MINDLASIVTAIILILFGAIAGYFMVYPEPNPSENLKFMAVPENANTDATSNKLNMENSNIKIDGNKINAGFSEDIFIKDSVNAKLHNNTISTDITDRNNSIVGTYIYGLQDDSENGKIWLLVKNDSTNNEENIMIDYFIPVASSRLGLQNDSEFGKIRLFFNNSTNNKDVIKWIIPSTAINVADERTGDDAYFKYSLSEMDGKWHWYIDDYNSLNRIKGSFDSIKLYRLYDNKVNFMKDLPSSAIFSSILLMLIGVYGIYLIASKK
jgi:hypothetical protein